MTGTQQFVDGTTRPDRAADAAGGSTAQRRRRARYLVAALVVLLCGAGGGWFVLSGPDVVPGSTRGRPYGITTLSDGIDDTKWLQSADRAGVYFTLRNDGRVPVTLSFDPSAEQGMYAPRLDVRFRRADPRGGTEGFGQWPRVPGASHRLRIPAGAEAFVIVHVAYPAACLAPAGDTKAGDTKSGDTKGGYSALTTLTLSADSLGRTTMTEIPLPLPLYTPMVAGCESTAYPYPAFPTD